MKKRVAASTKIDCKKPSKKEKSMKNILKESRPVLNEPAVSIIKSKVFILFATAALTAFLYPPLSSASSILGSAQSFAVLGHETVTNGHSDPNLTTQVYGNLGVTPGTSVTGFNSDGTVTGGTIHINDGVSQLALTDAMIAYTTLAALPFVYNYTGVDLGSAGHTTLTPGVYHFDTSAQLTGALTLDFQENPDANFIFQIGSTLTTASDSSINVINGNSLSGIYWQVGSSGTLGTDTVFAGNILALTSISLDPRAAILCGRAFALTGAVTLVDNFFSNNNTAQDYGSGRSDFGSYGFSGGSGDSAAPVPEPATMILFGSGLISLLSFKKKSRKSRQP